MKVKDSIEKLRGAIAENNHNWSYNIPLTTVIEALESAVAVMRDSARKDLDCHKKMNKGEGCCPVPDLAKRKIVGFELRSPSYDWLKEGGWE